MQLWCHEMCCDNKLARLNRSLGNATLPGLLANFIRFTAQKHRAYWLVNLLEPAQNGSETRDETRDAQYRDRDETCIYIKHVYSTFYSSPCTINGWKREPTSHSSDRVTELVRWLSGARVSIKRALMTLLQIDRSLSLVNSGWHQLSRLVADGLTSTDQTWCCCHVTGRQTMFVRRRLVLQHVAACGVSLLKQIGFSVPQCRQHHTSRLFL